MRALYVDLDGTLLGRGASLFHDADGEWTMLGARALEACHRAGVEVVIYSGRRDAQVHEDARLIGTRSYIFEVGCGLVIDGEREYLTDELQPAEGRSIHDQISDSGAARLLLDRYAGVLEYHSPWHLNREISHLFRGGVDAREATALLDQNGLGHLRLVDNGAISRHATLPDVERPHAFHLIPKGSSKSRAVGRHMQARGFAPEECIAVGDSREDMQAAEAVGTFWLVANALQKDPSLQAAIAELPNVRVTEGRNGEGVYEAVVTTLAERRG